MSALDIAFDPLAPWAVLAVAAAAALALLAWGAWVRAAGTGWRLAAALAFLFALANPVLVEEERIARPDVAAIVVDDSASQDIGGRAEVRDAALERVSAAMERMPDLEVRVVRVSGGAEGAGARSGRRGTLLFAAVERAVGDIPRGRLAGIVAITDGQVHDAPAAAGPEGGGPPAPFHAILTGRRGESDRRVAVEKAPAFGMVGRETVLNLRLEDPDLADGTPVPVTVSIDGGAPRAVRAPANRILAIQVPLTRAGETIVELRADARPGELSPLNNRTARAIVGVRDRLRVLLVSGEPHAGERTWRDLLKADPAVDLVHFTILRPPEKQDGTPIRELSLIAFPVRELFELKLDEFDLIVFDRYRRRGVLPRAYLANIAAYVRRGGALLEASGPKFAGPLSLARSPLGDVLPGVPTGEVVEAGFRPRVTERGLRHPVAAGLPGAARPGPDGARAGGAGWGRWFRQVEARASRGAAVLDGAGGRPLLLLDRVGEGRVAHLLSDHIWLWSRGFEGGGPAAELLRRVAHWLMREPELEEEDLRATVDGSRIEVARRSLDDRPRSVAATGPDGATETRPLVPAGPGLATAVFEAGGAGLYRFSDGELTRLAAVGALNPAEFEDLRTTDAILGPVAAASGGGVHWAAEDGVPELRRVRPGRAAAGRGWIGLRRNAAHEVAGVREASLAPPLLALALILAAAALAWRREAA